MKKIAVVIAHPDDEAFGPGGTIAKFAKDHEVHVLCATRGEEGKNFGKGKLEEVRSKELLVSSKILGVKKVYFLGFRDGTLSNNLYHKLADVIRKRFEKIKPEIVITTENRGVSGHLDHIAVSMVTTYVFYKLQYIKKLMYYCASRKASEKRQDYFVYFPPGYTEDSVDEVVDTSDVWELKKQAMFAHKSQKHDMDKILSVQESLPKKELYLVITK